MIGDVEGVRALAREMSQLAERTRAVARDLRAAEGVDFQSDAAERYRKELREQAASSEDAAGEIDDAARALLRHAAAVDGHLAKLASAARGVKDAISDVIS